MHGDMNQAQRESVIRRLRAGQIEIVVATDVAARGLDVEQIAHVINYDIPNDVEAYVHRIGRTGRAGRSGVATLFITPRERRMMREIERFTGTPIKPMKMPTRADVAARRIAVFKESLRKELASGDLELYVEVVTQLAEEGPYDMAEVAAAAARVAHGTRPAETAPAPAVVTASPAARPSSSPRPSPGDSPRGAPPPRGMNAPSGDDGDKVRLSMAVGKRDGIRPADVVGSIANEAGIEGREIGPIDIRDDITYVSVPTRYRDQVLEKLGGAKFRGRPVNMREAGAAPPERPRERPHFQGDRPRPPFGNDRPRFNKERPPSRGDAPRFNKERPRAAGDGPRFNSDRPRFNNDRPRFNSDKPPFKRKPPKR
jgi:ATP-dependent RNA helicase DeaD